MADTAIAITAGTGTNVDTRTEATNGNHRQVIVIGDPATNAGVAPVDATTGLAVNVTNASLTVASHAVTNAGTFAVQNTAATPAGNNNIGDVDIASIAAGDNNIGNVDIVSLPALAAGTNNIGDVDVLTINSVAPAFGSGVVGATVLRTTLASDSPGVIDSGTAGSPATDVVSIQGISSMTPVTVANTPLTNIGAGEYELVAASQSTQTLGATGASGDYLAGVLIVPETTGAGTVAIKDGSNTAINIFVTGTLSNLVPFFVPLGIFSTSGAWQITTGSNVHAIGVGNFT